MRPTQPRLVVQACLFAFLACALPDDSRAKTPPKHTSTIGTPIVKPPGTLQPGEFFLNPRVAPAGPMVMVVSLPEQIAYVYRNGLLIGASTVSTGKKGHETPTGVFTILQKHADHYSSIYDAAPMPYMQRLTWSGVALHAGRLPGYPASHGCIRMPYDFAQQLYKETANGMTIVVSDDRQFPSTLAHPGLFAPVDSRGQTTVELPPEGEFAWQPELASSGPVTILVTGQDRRVRVFRDGVQIGWSLFELEDPGRRLQLRVLTRLAEAPDAAGSEPRWMLVSGEETVIVGSTALLEGVRLPEAFLTRLGGVIGPGTTAVVTELPASGATTGTELNVVVAEGPGAR